MFMRRARRETSRDTTCSPLPAAICSREGTQTRVSAIAETVVAMTAARPWQPTTGATGDLVNCQCCQDETACLSRITHLCLKHVDGLETHVAPLADSDVVNVRDIATPQHHVVSPEHVLADVQRLRRLAHTPVCHREKLVPHIGVAVVEAAATCKTHAHTLIAHTALRGITKVITT